MAKATLGPFLAEGARECRRDQPRKRVQRALDLLFGVVMGDVFGGECSGNLVGRVRVVDE
jgi:hypothetical protein